MTGSARGIGRATAERLADHGARVVLSDLDGDLLRATADTVSGETAAHVGDLTKDGVPEQLVQTAIDTWGRLDILVNNAGYTLDAPVHRLSDDWWERMLDIHLTCHSE